MSDKTAVDSSTPNVHRRKGLKAMFKKNHEEAPPAPTTHVDSEELGLEERRHRALKKKIPVGAQLRAVLLGSWINVLLLFVPIGFALYYSKKVGPVPIFIVNFVAIIPLAAVLSYATEELAIRVGETFGGLLNATFGYDYSCNL
jgi:Ca2+:H+ antiporter